MRRLLVGLCMVLGAGAYCFVAPATWFEALAIAVGGMFMAAGLVELSWGERPRVEAQVPLVPRVVVNREGGR